MPKKPGKPHQDFPLYAHATGRWAKKIRGKTHYFGPWDDPQGALGAYLAQRDYLLAGRPAPSDGETVANLLDLFLDAKQKLVGTGEITPTTFKEYEATCVVIDAHFGKGRGVESLTLTDFQDLRVALSKGKKKEALSPVTLKRRLTIARMVFADQPRQHRKALQAPPKRLLRAARHKRGRLLYGAKEIRALVGEANPNLQAMILLGINCAFGPHDCCSMPTDVVDFDAGWHTFPRPKTEVERKCPLWPETQRAVQAIIMVGQPKVFQGRKWDRTVVAREFGGVCERAHVRNLGFYSLRRTFETIAGNAEVAQSVVDHIMGHTRHDMASVYRQTTFDDMLKKCADFVRAWYLGEVVIR